MDETDETDETDEIPACWSSEAGQGVRAVPTALSVLWMLILPPVHPLTLWSHTPSMRVLRLPQGPLTLENIRLLRSRPVFLAADEPSATAELEKHDIDFQIASDEVPADAILLIPPRPLDELVMVVDRLLGPGGCPWDQAQTHESLKKYLLEEAYETLDAIDSGSSEKLREELGDLLLQPLMHAQMRKRDGDFDIDDVARGITEKLVRRHPHVFGNLSVEGADEVLRNWDKIKQQEKGGEPQSILAGVPKGMASLLRAHEVSKRVVRVGFEWPNLEAVFHKLREEESELREAISNGSHERVESEIGDMLFTMVNIARWLKVEPEEALRRMLNRFTERFKHMEQAAGQDLRNLSAEEWDRLWEEAKSIKG
jgi:tetrapyrrole methylase family protein / MazG family protein